MTKMKKITRSVSRVKRRNISLQLKMALTPPNKLVVLKATRQMLLSRDKEKIMARLMTPTTRKLAGPRAVNTLKSRKRHQLERLLSIVKRTTAGTT